MPPRFSLILPAYNEARTLPATLSAARAAMAAVQAAAPSRGSGELIVVDNHSTDDTAKVARAGGAQVVFEPVQQISRARNAGARVAQSDHLIFLDADTLLPPELLCQALEALASGQVVAGGGLLAFDRPVGWLPRLTLATWNRVARYRRLAAGCFLFCRRDAFEAVGGFSERVYASEEIWLCRALKRQGRRHGQSLIILTEPRVVTSARKTERPWRTAATMLLMALFPPAVFFRRLCGFWYAQRPTAAPPA